MRVAMTISELDDWQFDLLQELLPAAGYGDLSMYASTVCVVFQRGQVERHVEMAAENLIEIWKRLEWTGLWTHLEQRVDRGRHGEDTGWPG